LKRYICITYGRFAAIASLVKTWIETRTRAH